MTTKPILAITAVALALLVSGCKEEVAQSGPSLDRPVKVVTLANGSETVTRSYAGSIRARTDSALSFRVGGKIVTRVVDIGDHVDQGTLIARLDPTDLKLSADAAHANLESARTRRDLAADELTRIQALAQKGFATKSQLDKATSDAEASASGLNAAVAQRDQAQNQAAYAELRADASGIVTDVRADAGQVVAAGTPVVVISRDGEKEVAFAVPEQTVAHLAKGQTVRVSTWVNQDKAMTGTIREIAGAADALSRTFAVRVALPQEANDPKVRLGMTATVEIDLPQAAGEPIVPLSALAAAPDGAQVVWVVDRSSQTVSQRRVELGRAAAEGVRISSGLEPGETVVVAGTQFMRDGLKVRVAGTEAAERTAALSLKPIE